MTTESISPLLSAMSSRLETGAVTSNYNSNAGAEFQQVLCALIMSLLSTSYWVMIAQPDSERSVVLDHVVIDEPIQRWKQ